MRGFARGGRPSASVRSATQPGCGALGTRRRRSRWPEASGRRRSLRWAAFGPMLLLALPTARGAPPGGWLDDHVAAVVDLYTSLHRSPELSLEEHETAARMAEELRRVGAEVTTGVGGHGVVGVIRNGRGPTIMLRADMDALPVVEQTGLPYASAVRVRDERGTTVGVMHACGHDVHMAAAIGAVRCLTDRRDAWSGTLLVVMQPAEEKGGGARRMIADGLFHRFPRPEAAVALHCASDLATGVVSCGAGPMNANVDSVDIVVKGRGGHGAYPHTTVDPVVVAARLVVDLQALVSREIDPLEPAVITVGSIHGGTKHNIIPDECRLQLTVRSCTERVRRTLLDGIRRMALAASQAAAAPEPEIVFSTETTPAVVNDPQLAERVVAALRRAAGPEQVLPGSLTMGGEDFSLYGLEGVPACMFRLGTVPQARLDELAARGESAPSLHSPRYAPDPEGSLRTAISCLVAVVEELLPAGGTR